MPKRVNCVAQLQDGSVGIIQALAVFDGSPPQLQPQYLVLVEKLDLVPSVAFMDVQLGISFTAVREGTRSGDMAACKLNALKRKCVAMEHTPASFLVLALPNLVECD